MPAGGAMHLKSASSVRLSGHAAKGEAPTPSCDEDSSPSPPAPAVPPARNKRGMYVTVVCQSVRVMMEVALKAHEHVCGMS